MTGALELSTVRVLKNSDHSTVGVGFLVSSQHIITCAHVVAYALGMNVATEQQPEQNLKINFFVIDSSTSKLIEARVIVWNPVLAEQLPKDFAVLRIVNLDSIPETARPIKIINSANLDMWNYTFRTVGCPKKVGKGAWADGSITGRVGDGLIQIEGYRVTGYRLEPGFSGAAIWSDDLKGVVGMAVKEDAERTDAKVARMIPTEFFFQAWNGISQFCSIDNRLSRLIVLLDSYFKDENNQISKANREIINKIYQKSLPEIAIRDCPEFINQIIKQLDSYKQRKIDEYLALDIFVANLYLKISEEDRSAEIVGELRTWLEKYTSNHQELINLLEQEQRDLSQTPPDLSELSLNQSPCLLIGVFEENNENQALSVRAWLIRDSNQYNPNEGSGCDRLTDEKNKRTTDRELTNLPKLINIFHEQCLAICKRNLNRVYVSLPYNLIHQHQAIDKIVIENSNPYQPSMGIRFEIAVRFSERFKSVDTGDQYLFSCLEKWHKAKNQNNEQQPIIQIFRNDELNDSRSLFQKLMLETTVGFSTDRPIAKSVLVSIMEVFYYSGIPLALWIRDDLENLDVCQDIEDFCQECCVNNLSNMVQQRRLQDWGQEAIGDHLSFLLENFDLMPPKNLLSMS